MTAFSIQHCANLSWALATLGEGAPFVQQVATEMQNREIADGLQMELAHLLWAFARFDLLNVLLLLSFFAFFMFLKKQTDAETD